MVHVLQFLYTWIRPSLTDFLLSHFKFTQANWSPTPLQRESIEQIEQSYLDVNKPANWLKTVIVDFCAWALYIESVKNNSMQLFNIHCELVWSSRKTRLTQWRYKFFSKIIFKVLNRNCQGRDMNCGPPKRQSKMVIVRPRHSPCLNFLLILIQFLETEQSVHCQPKAQLNSELLLKYLFWNPLLSI